MNSTLYNKKLKIYNELSGLLSIKRKAVCSTKLVSFIDVYLKHLSQQQRPLFHKTILKRIQTIAIGSKQRQEGTQSFTEDNKHTEGEGKMTPHTPTLKNHLKDPTDFSPVNTNPLLDNTDNDKSTQTPYSGAPLNLNRMLFIAPRGFAKSTLCSRFFPLWLALYGYKKDIFLISATISIAKENLRIIRNELESNEKLIQDFGDLKSDKWTEEQLVLKNGVTIRAKGQGFQIRGFRPDIIICDDLEDDSVIYSKEQRDKLEVWFFRTLLPTLKPDQHLIYIGTKLHQFALIAKLEKDYDFTANLYKALVDGKSIWEDAWPTEELLKRKKQSLYAFEAEYQNNPLSLEEQPVKIHHLEGVKTRGGIIESCMSLDPAISEKDSSDYRAIQIMGKTEEGEFRELLTVRGKWGVDEMVDKVIDLYVEYKNKWSILRVLVEEVAFQKIIRTLLLKKSREKGIYMPISTTELGVGANKRPKDKLTRLMQVVHLFEGRLVEIRNTDLFQELLAFPFGDYDDMVDVTVYNLYWLINNRPGKYMLKKEKLNFPIKTQESFYIQEPRPGVFVAKAGGPPFKPRPKLFINYDK